MSSAELPAAPTVSVILPVRREGAEFVATLRRVLEQDYPALTEVLVVDGMSDDDTREIVRNVARRHPRVRLLDNPRGIVPTAMNVGIVAATGTILVRVDGHTRIRPDYVSRCVAALRASRASCVGGRMDAVGETFVGRVVAAATSGPFGVGNSHFHYSDTARFTETVYLGAWPKETLVRAGGFDEEMVRDQDDELNYRLRKAGGTVWLDPAIRSEYTPRGSLAKLWSQYRQYGLWKVRVFQKHPAMMRWRHFVPAAFVLAAAASVGLALAVPWGRWLVAGGAAVYVAAAAAAAVATPAGAAERLLMPIVFATIHTAYGAGFLAGLVRFFPRWFQDRSGRGPSRDLASGLEEKRP
jgi:glycosyltransferase involved in cell wall biosynthesis